mmetsp:Transcript_17070/g.25246  ORF Transcript_17070/g.25246 Transcript_17070/m.25246 type:complete len:95 (-) Transcript_17070:125-409(-)
MSMYLRLKRKNATLFLYVEPTSEFREIKSKIGDLIKVDPNTIGLFGSEDKSKELIDSATVDDQEIKNDQIVYFLYKNGSGGYEDFDVSVFPDQK